MAEDFLHELHWNNLSHFFDESVEITARALEFFSRGFDHHLEESKEDLKEFSFALLHVVESEDLFLGEVFLSKSDEAFNVGLLVLLSFGFFTFLDGLNGSGLK